MCRGNGIKILQTSRAGRVYSHTCIIQGFACSTLSGVTEATRKMKSRATTLTTSLTSASDGLGMTLLSLLSVESLHETRSLSCCSSDMFYIEAVALEFCALEECQWRRRWR